MNLTNVTPTEYVWKYNPLSGIPAGAQQNYGATINWVLPGGRFMARVAEDIRSRTLSPMTTSAITARFEAESDQQPFAGPRESSYIAATVIDSGFPRSGLYPLDPSGMQRVQLSGGRTEGRVQMSGGLTEGQEQLSGGFRAPQRVVCAPPRWCGASMTGNGLRDRAEMTSDAFKYFLRTEGPSKVVDEPGVFTQRQFMTKFVPAVVPRPFDSGEPGSFPAYYSPIYKGRTAFEDQFYDW
ncbi:protein VIII [Southern Psittacara leucophthalmus aviadenovirus]|uniref:Pre-hexon-linking protein VIII n=1 Tax=Southern Psittacara leucophthalmus aviadenovirus TaxID=2604330 RepID=A0AAF1DB85_9ADEN|nr:protein VIII [Southern Psittacara leucophthalmus aviadenovirus]QEJ80780.1 protein VIII [Southern Psittacara leucophthalmus aviadenovirus]